MRPRLAAALVALTLFGVGCQRNSAIPLPRLSLPSPKSVLCVLGELEDCFTYPEMNQFVSKAVPLVQRFFDETYSSMPLPRRAVYVPHGTTHATACVGPAADQGAYFYCPADLVIYLGQDTLWRLYKIGDAAAVAGLAHEWGHHVQTVAHVPAPETTQESIRYENQADCVAGAWVRFAEQKKWIDYPDDIVDLGGLLDAIGSAEGPTRDHGTVSERTSSFIIGLRDGLTGCNRFYPSAPLYRAA